MLDKYQPLNLKLTGTRRSSQSLPHSSDQNIIPSSHPNQQLMLVIKQYEQMQQDKQQTESQRQENKELGINNIQEVYIESNIKNNSKPVHMFKDQMQLKKENAEKKIIVKELENLNKQLKLEYDTALNNNKKMEMFLKQIEFTFKNDRSNQKANEILLKATKTLNRQKQQSRNYIEKLIKTVKINEMRQLKSYVKVLENEKQRLYELLNKEERQNEKLREIEDFNQEEVDCFEYCQNLMKEILQEGLYEMSKTRQNYKKQKTEIKIKLCHKQVQCMKRQISKIDQLIVKQLLKKQGLEYETQLITNKMKSKNKRSIKEQGSILKQQIKNKKMRINMLAQEYKEKKKTQQYITKWTKQLKNQLEELKENHKLVKEQYQQQINKLSKEIQQWNRKYKTQLIEQQSTNKKGVVKEIIVGRDSAGPQRKIRIVKIYQIENLKKKLMFYLIENNLDGMEYVREKILGYNKSITLKQLHRRLCELEPFEDEDSGQVFKLARYIVEDNNNDYTKINPEEAIEVSIALLIFKNLLASDLNNKNLPLIKAQLKQFFNKNFDAVRHQIWQNSGKSTTFNAINLRNALAKYIQQQITISKYIQLIQYLIWKKFAQGNSFKISSFEKICEILLGKKLVKDERNRISKATIKSVYNRIYNNLLQNQTKQ